MEQRKLNRFFTFEKEHTLPYTNPPPEPEKTLSLYNRVTTVCSTICHYTKNLIVGWFKKEEPVEVISDDLEKGVPGKTEV